MKSFVVASDKAVLIMTGIGGSENGYENKYFEIARILNEKYDASVFIFATPREAWQKGENLVDEAISEVDRAMSKRSTVGYDLYCFGTSAGASFLGSFTYKYPQVKKLILVNPVMQINYNKLLRGLDDSRAEVNVVFGEDDPSRKFVGLLDLLKNKSVKTTFVPNADHCFSGEENERIFKALPESFFS